MIRALAILCGLTLGCSGREPKHVVLQSSQPDTHSVRGAGPMDARRSDGVRQYCARSTGTIRVSEDSVGPFELWTPLRALRNICPSADDTIVYGTETSTPGVAFHFQGLTAVALQFQDTLLPDRPPDVWSVQGPNGSLLGEVPLAAPWATFQAALGSAIASPSTDDDHVTVVFCAHRRFFLRLKAPSTSVEGQSKDLSGIPAAASIEDIGIFPREQADWHC